MRARIWLYGALAMALVVQCGAWAQGAKSIYDAQKPNGGAFLKGFTGWGSGTVDEAEEGPGLVISTSGYYEGGQFSFAGAKIEDAVTNVQNGFITLTLKVEQEALQASTMTGVMGSGSAMGSGSVMGSGSMMGSGSGKGPSSMGGMGSGGPGMIPGMGGGSSGGPGMVPGMPGGGSSGGPGMVPGMPGGGGMMVPGIPGGSSSGMMPGGAAYTAVEQPAKLTKLRVVLVTTTGTYAIEDIDASGVPSQEPGWETVALPLAEFASRAGVPAGEIQEVRICGDATGKITLGGIQLFQEDPADVVNVTAPEDATYEWGETFSLKAVVDDPTKQFRLHWDFDSSDGVTYDGETGDTVEDANYYFPAPGEYTVTVVAVPITNRALPRMATCRITLKGQAGNMMPGGMMPGGGMVPGMMPGGMMPGGMMPGTEH